MSEAACGVTYIHNRHLFVTEANTIEACDGSIKERD